MKAVKGDEWSAVISSQTHHTVEGMLVADGILNVSIAGFWR